MSLTHTVQATALSKTHTHTPLLSAHTHTPAFSLRYNERLCVCLPRAAGRLMGVGYITVSSCRFHCKGPMGVRGCPASPAGPPVCRLIALLLLIAAVTTAAAPPPAAQCRTLNEDDLPVDFDMVDAAYESMLRGLVKRAPRADSHTLAQCELPSLAAVREPMEVTVMALPKGMTPLQDATATLRVELVRLPPLLPFPVVCLCDVSAPMAPSGQPEQRQAGGSGPAAHG